MNPVGPGPAGAVPAAPVDDVGDGPAEREAGPESGAEAGAEADGPAEREGLGDGRLREAQADGRPAVVPVSDVSPGTGAGRPRIARPAAPTRVALPAGRGPTAGATTGPTPT